MRKVQKEFTLTYSIEKIKAISKTIILLTKYFKYIETVMKNEKETLS